MSTRVLQTEALRKELEAAQLQECTVRPQLLPKFRRWRANTACLHKRIPEAMRMVLSGGVLQTEALRKELEAAQLQECTFRPQLLPRLGHRRVSAARGAAAEAAEPAGDAGPAQQQAAAPRLPLHERLADLEKHRRYATKQGPGRCSQTHSIRAG